MPPKELLKLSENFQSARDALHEAWIPVNRAFISTDLEPTDQELTNLESAILIWDDAKKQMSKFIASRSS
jgi:hypothetical protein